MSFIVKGIDLPKNTSAIEIVFIPNLNKDEVAITEPFVLSANEVIQISKGHGSLKDSKEILARAEQEVDGLVMSAEHLPMVLEWILDKSDTFLEAEE